MAPRREKGDCKCGILQQMADDAKCPVEFDSELNEYHIECEKGGQMMVHFCPFCGGRAPKSKRSLLFHRLTDKERQGLLQLTKDLKTVNQVTNAFGKPDRRHPIGFVTVAPEREGRPEITEGLPLLVYSKLSDTAEVYVTVYPDQKVGISLQTKAMKKNEG